MTVYLCLIEGKSLIPLDKYLASQKQARENPNGYHISYHCDMENYHHQGIFFKVHLTVHVFDL